MKVRETGLLIIDKAAGMTSHDVIDRVRKKTGLRAGHSGTLDPQATGVLLVCVGSSTRLARFLQGHDKVYEGVVRLGWATDTYDAEGDPAAHPIEPPPLDRRTVEAALQEFVGTFEQTPPVYSAKKLRGQPAYKRARRGEPVTPDPVEVTVYSAELLNLRADEIDIKIHCGAGTYVRTLAHDLGAALGCPAHLAGLRRTHNGPFALDEALEWQAVTEMSGEELRAAIIPAADALPDWPAAVISIAGIDALRTGRMLETGWILARREGGSGAPEGWVKVLDERGEMRAAGEMVPGGLIQPRIVLQPSSTGC